MFLINSNIKQALCLVIFSVVVSSNVNSLANKVTSTSKPKMVMNYIGSAVGNAANGAALSIGGLSMVYGGLALLNKFDSVKSKLVEFRWVNGDTNSLLKPWDLELKSKTAIGGIVVISASALAGLALGIKAEHDAEALKESAISMQDKIGKLESELYQQNIDNNFA
jgi:hypothetical protein